MLCPHYRASFRAVSLANVVGVSSLVRSTTRQLLSCVISGPRRKPCRTAQEPDGTSSYLVLQWQYRRNLGHVSLPCRRIIGHAGCAADQIKPKFCRLRSMQSLDSLRSQVRLRPRNFVRAVPIPLCTCDALECAQAVLSTGLLVRQRSFAPCQEHVQRRICRRS